MRFSPLLPDLLRGSTTADGHPLACGAILAHSHADATAQELTL